jgi:Cys-tRNA(Pro)/Cys-tRNA(Cys) deacylase
MGRDDRRAAKTNALRIAEALGIAHRVACYEADEEDLSATTAAAKIGIPPERVFKTLALRGARTGLFLCCVPADEEVDLRKAAKAAGEKSVEMLPLKDLLPATGYVRGGCSPVGTKRAVPVYIDETAALLDEISVSAGARGLQMILAPSELARALEGRAIFADLT